MREWQFGKYNWCDLNHVKYIIKAMCRCFRSEATYVVVPPGISGWLIVRKFREIFVRLFVTFTISCKLTSIGKKMIYW